jgi:hypothetical protein
MKALRGSLGAQRHDVQAAQDNLRRRHDLRSR